MKKWVLKAVVQKGISYLPGGHKINYLFQKYVTKGVNLSDEYFFDRLTHAKEHMENYEKLSPNTPLSTSLEIGTGWYPVVPISLFLYGAQNIYTIDISPLLTKESLKIALTRVINANNDGSLNRYVKVSPERLVELKRVYEGYDKMDFNEILAALKINYVLKDARNTGFPDKHFDMISSNNTFEHIYPEILEGILKEFKRIIKQGGVMSHSIDLSDHFAHFDKAISVFNFLKYSAAQWKMIDNSIQPQNRYRVNEYKDLYKKLGIPITMETLVRGNMEVLKGLDLDEKYSSEPLEDIAVIHCSFASLMV
ncbi:MAG TPA: class I SAM-dependent methyltransferase [Bacteroidia bacterium]|nr:class I SAM-dependent methyltransferase [Bacteroidia bacterium]